MAESILVVWNANAGTSGRFAEVHDALSHTAGIRLVTTDSRENSLAVVTDAIARGVRRIIAAGGDGTVNAVVSAVAESGGADVDVAVLPLGTGNDLSRTLAMPLDPTIAIELCLHGTARPIDVIEAKSNSTGACRIVANMATAGNSGKYTAVLTSEMKQAWGPLCYLRGVVDVLQDLDVFDVTIQCDGEPPERFAALNLFVANGRYSGGGMTVAPDATLDSHRLELAVVRDGTAVDLAGLAMDYVVGDFRENELITTRSARTVRIESRPSLPFSVDGDELDGGPVTFTVRPAAVRMVFGPDPATS